MAGGDEDIGVYEAAGAGVIVAGLEVVEGGFGIVDIAAVAQGVCFAEGCRHAARGGADIAPGIIGIFYDNGAAAVHDGNNIALEVGDIEIRGSVVLHGNGRTVGIVGIVQRFRIRHGTIYGGSNDLACSRVEQRRQWLFSLCLLSFWNRFWIHSVP